MKTSTSKNKPRSRKITPLKPHLPPFKVNKVIASLSEVQQWGIRQLKIPEVWKVTQGENITVMVIDTGFPDHNDLDGAMIKEKSRNFITGDDIFDRGTGHSSHCCGIIGARQNDMGCVGVAPKCNIITCKVLGYDGSGSFEAVNTALEYAILIKPDVVSMSLGSSYHDLYQEKLIKKLFEMNIPVIAAAGNEGGKNQKRNTVNYPGKLEEVVTVAAVKEDGSIAEFSSWGEEVDIAAPGYNIYSTYLDQQYCNMSGTSMATPFIAGIVALMLAKHRKQELETGINDCKTVTQIKEHLYKYADKNGVIGWEQNSFGYGRVDPIKSIIENSAPVSPILPQPKKSWWQKVKSFFSNLIF